MRARSPIAIFLVTTALFALAALPPTVWASPPVVGATLAGRITDGVTGAPIAGAQVWGWVENGMKDDARTDADGRYRLDLSAGPAHIEARMQDYYPVNMDKKLEPNDNTLDIQLKPVPGKTATLTGTVRAQDGTPLAKARVSVAPKHPVYYATDAKEAPAGAAEPSSSGASGDAAQSKIAPESYPYPGYDDWSETTTDENGRFTLQARPGEKQVTAMARGYVIAQQDVRLADGQTTDVALALEKAPSETASVRGRVVDAISGAPIQGASVSAYNLEWGRSQWVQTGRDGAFEFKLPPGYTQLSVHYWGGCCYAVAYEDSVATTQTTEDDAPQQGTTEPAIAPRSLPPVREEGPKREYYAWMASRILTSGDNTLEVKLEPKPEPTIPLIGYVVNEKTKTGIPGAWVNVRNEDTGDWGNAQTDKDGSYKIMVRPGRHVVEAGAEGHFHSAVTMTVHGATVARVGAGAPQRQDMHLHPGETKQVYWDDCCEARPLAADGDAKAGAYESGAPAPGVQRTAMSSGVRDDGSRTQTGSIEGATYQGGAGGLGPYTPEATHYEQPHMDPRPGFLVPAPAAVLTLISGAFVALAAARRKG